MVATAAAVGVAVATGAAAQPATGATQATTSDVVVLVAPGETGRVLSQYGLTARLVYTSALDGFAASVTDQQRRRLESDRAVRGIARDEQFTADAGTPIEASPQRIPRGTQWVGATDSPSAAIDGIDATLDVDIAVLDTGIQPDQPDLRVVGGVDCTRSKGGYADDNGHVTIVSGVAAALDNSFGVVAGAAPGRAGLGGKGAGPTELRGRTSGLLCGIDWVTGHSDVIEVADVDLGGTGSDDGNCGRTKRDPLYAGDICRSVAAGVTYVTSAGNDAVDVATKAAGVLRRSHHRVGPGRQRRAAGWARAPGLRRRRRRLLCRLLQLRGGHRHRGSRRVHRQYLRQQRHRCPFGHELCGTLRQRRRRALPADSSRSHAARRTCRPAGVSITDRATR